MPVDIHALVNDLAAESAVVDGLLVGLRDADWERPTPSIGWNITDQVGHLAYFDQTAVTSLLDADRFRREAALLVADGNDFADRVAAEFHSTKPEEMFRWFRAARAELIQSYLAVDPRMRLPWYGPDMGVASSVTARLMETWAHGQDIADALGQTREPTSRLRHVAHLGVAGLPYSYAVNEMELPSEAIRVEIIAPDGQIWGWGPEYARDRVSGSALDFCLAVTQRRHLDDLDLRISGVTANQWMGIAQTYAGPAGAGRARQDDTTIGTDK
ncbi:MAG: TIGR03084 family metal-binding protein [Solirubrobacterales bacterium]